MRITSTSFLNSNINELCEKYSFPTDRSAWTEPGKFFAALNRHIRGCEPDLTDFQTVFVYYCGNVLLNNATRREYELAMLEWSHEVTSSPRYIVDKFTSDEAMACFKENMHAHRQDLEKLSILFNNLLVIKAMQICTPSEDGVLIDEGLYRKLLDKLLAYIYESSLVDNINDYEAVQYQFEEMTVIFDV